ncbi:hypothetical protein Syun_014002 [Stephania yunnanensis]|uniref:UVR domain-containing protein n=1 Tax=Stephania yunnanensis TaxID=152371 RepID=A0AAP0JKS7_9MAGN
MRSRLVGKRQYGHLQFLSNSDPIDPSPTSTSTPLDENLFSDLTLTSPSPQSPLRHTCRRCRIDALAAGRDPIWVPTDLEEEEEGQVLQKELNLRCPQLKARAVSEVSKLRKEVARKRRKAAKNVNLSAVNYRELEEELEEACEAEDFERANRVSERLSEVENERCNL